MSKNNQNGNVATLETKVESKAMQASPESVAQIATVATPANEEQDKAKRLESHREAEKLAIQKRAEKLARREEELKNSPLLRLCGEQVKTVAIERAIANVDRESGRLKATAKAHGMLSIKEAADGKQALIYDTACVRNLVKSGLAGDGGKSTEKDITHMKRLIGALVHFGVMQRPESFDTDEE